MRLLLTAVVSGLSVASALISAAPVTAGPGDNPCGLAINLLCRFVPIAPELDHDIDLTRPPGPDNPVPASLVPVVAPTPERPQS